MPRLADQQELRDGQPRGMRCLDVSTDPPTSHRVKNVPLSPGMPPTTRLLRSKDTQELFVACEEQGTMVPTEETAADRLAAE